MPASPLDLDVPALDKRDWIAGLEKGLSIIETFDEANPRLTATQAAERCGLTRTAARRYLLTLMHLGYVASDGKLFWLTPRVMRLGQSYLESARLPRIVQPFLQRLTAGTQEISYVSVLDGVDIVYVARNGSNRTMNTGFVLGARVPAQVTAGGMLLIGLQGEQAVDHWLAHHDLQTFTSHTITNKERMRLEMARIRRCCSRRAPTICTVPVCVDVNVMMASVIGLEISLLPPPRFTRVGCEPPMMLML